MLDRVDQAEPRGDVEWRIRANRVCEVIPPGFGCTNPQPGDRPRKRQVLVPLLIGRDVCNPRHPIQPRERIVDRMIVRRLRREQNSQTLEADRVDPGRGYAEAALANVRWALTHQHENGWFAHCCLSDRSQPLTHTLGYALRGVIEAARYTGDAELQRAARRTADGLRSALGADGFLPGRLLPDWRPAVRWVCLTGSVQIAACWLLLHADTGEASYLEAARAANRFVRRTLRLDGSAGLRGGVKGSFPVDGAYGRYQLLNWAAKFMIDANLLELRAAGGDAA